MRVIYCAFIAQYIKSRKKVSMIGMWSSFHWSYSFFFLTLFLSFSLLVASSAETNSADPDWQQQPRARARSESGPATIPSSEDEGPE